MKAPSENPAIGFARRLKAARASLGYTQEQFSLQLRIKRDRYAKYELGQAEPPFFILIRVSELTNQSLDVLIGSKADPSGKTTDVMEPQLADIRLGRKVSYSWWWKSDRNHVIVEIWHPDTSIPQGKQKPSIVGKTRWEIAGVADPSSDPHWQKYLEDVEAHRPFSNFRYDAITGKGEKRTVVISGRPVFDENQEFMGYAGSGHWDDEEAEQIAG